MVSLHASEQHHQSGATASLAPHMLQQGTDVGHRLSRVPSEAPELADRESLISSTPSTSRGNGGLIRATTSPRASRLLIRALRPRAPLSSEPGRPVQVVPYGAGLRLVDAVRTTLELHPFVEMQELALLNARGRLQESRGQFDATVTALTRRERQEIPTSTTEELALLTNKTSYAVEVSKQFRTGLTLTPNHSVTRMAETRLASSAASLLGEIPNQSNLSLNLTQPLRRGRGRDIVGAVERINEIELQASDRDLTQVRSQRALVSVVTYWEYLAALRILDVLETSEARSRDLVERTQELIDAGNRPAADLTQAQANLSGHVSQRLGAEQEFVAAGYALALALGLPTADVDLPPRPTNDFPPISENDIPSRTFLVREATEQRADLAAARDRVQQERLGLTVARNALQPRLDLSASAGYVGLNVGGSFGKLFSPFWASLAGPTVSAALTLELPLINDSAKGQLVQSRSALTQQMVKLADLERTIGSNVLVAHDNLIRSAKRVRSSQAAAQLYRTAIVDEQLKQELGLSTVIDLIVTEERLTESLTDEIAARLSHAVAIASLRYEAGTLLRPGPVTEAVDLQRLTTIPRPRPDRP